MKILLKSAVVKEQFETRNYSTNKAFELHLNNNDLLTSEDIESKMSIIEESGVHVDVVHSPMINKFEVEGLADDSNMDAFCRLCEFATLIGEKQGTEITIVLHQAIQFDYVKDFGLLPNIKRNMNLLLSTFPSIHFAIENIPPFLIKNGIIEGRGTQYEDAVKLVKALRDSGDINFRIHNCLDICHMLSEIQIQKMLSETMEPVCMVTIKEYMDIYLPTTKVIHLSNSRNCGMPSGHGVGFDYDEELDVLYYIMDRLIRFGYNEFITLETTEKDLLNPLNSMKLYKELQNIVVYELKGA